jgi:Dyp-type peroxidase family
MENVEWQDVQGLVLSGFPDLRHAAYIPWRFDPPESNSIKQWLEGLAGRLIRVDGTDSAAMKVTQTARHRPARPTSLKAMKRLLEANRKVSGVGVVNLALTAGGLKAFGVDEQELARFSSEFREGMAPEPRPGSAVPRRSNVLGDIGSNSPEHWQWGGWNTHRTIDGLLLLYATDPTSLQALIDEELGLMQGVAQPLYDGERLILRGRVHDDLREHFGYRDGISQPTIEGTKTAAGLSRKETRISVVRPGEFVLGYLNERGARVTFSSASVQGARHAAALQSRDLGRNGTYLVFRQLEQDVRAFNDFISQTATLVRGPDVGDAKKAEEWVAARLVGRKRSGEPLIPAAADSTKGPDARNDFLYHFEDRFGLACPIGSHIRRANPRDIIGPDPDTALRLSKMHRIIRRGRSYGERLTPAAGGESIPGQHEPRGLHFICLNADIAGQFELIQHSWLNGTHFDGLYDETDPISHYPAGDGVMTIQHRPTNLRISIPRFVTVRGGAYFFLPGIKALRSLSQ